MSQEDEFSIVVLKKAQRLFGEKQKYLKLARMVKLVAFVADEIDFKLTRGWYKFGIYSPNAYIIAKDYSEDDLPSLKIPEELIEDAMEKFHDKISSIESAIKKFKPIFIKDKTSFYNWVYGKKAPKEYRSFYKAHQEFIYFLESTVYLRSPTILQSDIEEKFESLDTLITNYHNHIDHIEDESIANLFYEYIDLFEMIMLKIKNNKYCVNENGLNFLERIKELYCNNKYDLWTLLVPYNETLRGLRADVEKVIHKNRVSTTKVVVGNHLKLLFNSAERFDFLPSFKELEIEIRKYDKIDKDRKPLREIYSSS